MILILAIISLAVPAAFSQTFDNYQINSPYSRIGIGNIAPEGSIRNYGMGGTGVSNSNGQFLNIINPALLINNRIHKYDSMTTVLDGAMVTELRKISDNNAKQLRGNANFYSFYYAFPLSKRWVTAVGLRPYSNVSYNIFQNAPVAGTTETANLTLQGTGGINRGEIANAFRIGKSLQLGFSASYLFGAVNHLSSSQLTTDQTQIIVGSNQKINYRGFLLRPGISYRKKLSGHSADSAVYLNIGFAYDWYANMHGNEEFFIERRTFVNQVISRISEQAVNRSLTFPSIYRSGISLDNNIWNVALDYTYYNYNNYVGVNASDTLKNGFTVALGGELALGKEKRATNSLKIRYVRAGVSYTKSPITVRGKQLNELAFSLGYSFPVGKPSYYRIYNLPRPQINLALVVGQRGGFDNNLVKEQYIRGFLGFTINDKWFKRRRIE